MKTRRRWRSMPRSFLVATFSDAEKLLHAVRAVTKEVRRPPTAPPSLHKMMDECDSQFVFRRFANPAAVSRRLPLPQRVAPCFENNGSPWRDGYLQRAPPCEWLCARSPSKKTASWLRLKCGHGCFAIAIRSEPCRLLVSHPYCISSAPSTHSQILDCVVWSNALAWCFK